MKFSFFKYEPFLLLTILIAAMATLWMTANRLEGFNFVSSSYQDLYEFTDKLIVQDFDAPTPNQLQIGAAQGTPTTYTGSESSSLSKTIDLTEGQHPQFIDSRDDEKIPVFWTMWGDNIDPVVIGNVSVPIGRPAFELRDFVIPVSRAPADQVENARRIAFDEFGVPAENSTIDMLRPLAVGLHRNLFPHRGSPRPEMRRLNGMSQYEAALAGNSGIYCENHAEIFAFFANAIGIPTRVVGAAGKHDGVALGAHAFAESFIRETGTWMYIDLQLNIFGVLDESSAYIGAADFIHRMAANSERTLQIEELSEDGIAWNTVANRSEEIGMFLHPKVTLVYLWGLLDRYHPIERLKKLLINPQPSYSLRRIGVGAELRIISTYILFGLMTTWVILRARHMLK